MQFALAVKPTDQLLAQGTDQLIGTGQTVAPRPRLQVAKEFLRCPDADIGQDQGLFQLLPRLLVDLPAPPQPSQMVRQKGPCPAETVPEPGPL